MSEPDEIIMTYDEFLSGAQTSDLFQQVADEIARKQRETVVSDASARRDAEWSILANQVVGGENFHVS